MTLHIAGKTISGPAIALLMCAGVACTSGADDTAIDDTQTMESAQTDATNPCDAAANPCAPNPCAAAANPCAAEAPQPAGRAPLPDVATTIGEFLDKDSDLQKYFDEAAGYAVFPTVGKAGFVVGGAHGNGELIVHGSPIGTTEISEVSVGLQAGGQQFSEIIFFETDADVDQFTSGKLEFSSGFSAVAVVGGATDKPNYRQGVVVFTLPKGGLMAEMSVGGQKFKFRPY